MPELYVEARAENDAEQLQNGQAQANRAQDDQVIFRRLQKLVDTTLNTKQKVFRMFLSFFRYARVQ